MEPLTIQGIVRAAVAEYLASTERQDRELVSAEAARIRILDLEKRVAQLERAIRLHTFWIDK